MTADQGGQKGPQCKNHCDSFSQCFLLVKWVKNACKKPTQEASVVCVTCCHIQAQK